VKKLYEHKKFIIEMKEKSFSINKEKYYIYIYIYIYIIVDILQDIYTYIKEKTKNYLYPQST